MSEYNVENGLINIFKFIFCEIQPLWYRSYEWWIQDFNTTFNFYLIMQE